MNKYLVERFLNLMIGEWAVESVHLHYIRCLCPKSGTRRSGGESAGDAELALGGALCLGEIVVEEGVHLLFQYPAPLAVTANAESGSPA